MTQREVEAIIDAITATSEGPRESLTRTLEFVARLVHDGLARALYVEWHSSSGPPIIAIGLSDKVMGIKENEKSTTVDAPVGIPSFLLGEMPSS